MARRRVGAPQAAAGDVWRQQQQLAALAGALQQLPRGDALPLVLLRGLQRMLACVEHTLQGPPSCPGAGTATGSGSGDGGCSGPAAAKVEPLTDAAAAEGAAVPSDMREVGVEHLKSVTEGRVQDASSREAMAAARAVGILQDLLASVADGNGGSGGDGDGGCGPLYYAEALLHNFLALSSDLFDVITVECRTAVSVGSRTPVAASNGDGDGSHGWRGFRRDELAAAARRKLPAGVYVRIVAALGWDARLLDLLAWLPHPAVASAALARAMELHSAIAPAIAEALLGAGAGCAGAADLDRDAAGSPSWAHRIASNPRVVLSVAHSVRQAAAKELSGGADKPAWDGRRWLPCLLLLGRALAQTLRRRLASTAAAAAVAVTTTAGGDCAGDDQWEDACCEALQEGLCVCQADILAASGAAKTAAADADAVAATATALLQLVQGELAGLLDEQRGGGGVVGAPHGLLSHGSALRLRTRIMLLGMQAASASAAANAPPPPISATAAAAAAGNAQLLPRPELPTGEGTVRLAAEDVWRDLPYGSAAAGPVAAMADPSGTGPAPGQAPAPLAPAGAEGPGRPQTRRLPDWLRAASLAAVAPSGAPRAGGGTDALQLLLSRGAVKNAMTAAAAAAPAVPAPAPSAAATARAAAAAVALLTPGLGSWLRVQSDPRVGSAAGPDPYSPFRMALALLELLQGLQGPGGGARSGADPDAAGSAVNAAVGGDGGTGPGAPAGGLCGGAEVERVEAARQLELQVLRMAAECLACVGAPEQQAALQAVVLDSPDFASLRARLAADAALQAAACRALVALSNRAAAVEGSLERLALSAQQEAERLAAAATNLLPYAVLVPEACIRRLVLDGLTHPGQQPWVLQLLRCFAVAAAAPAAAAGAPAPAAPVPMLLSCVRDVVLGDAARWLRTAAERRSLLGLLGGLLRAGLLAPRQLLSALVEPALSGTAEGGRRSVPQVYCGLLVAQLVMGGSETAGLPPAAYCPMTELAAARPARLLLAAAAALGELYDTYTGSRRLEAAAIDAAATVLERAVQLYGTYLSTTRHEGDVGELRDLSEGCATLPRHPVAVLLPLLELAAASSQGDDGAGGGDDGDEGDGGGIRALSAWFAPATRWRPRGLRTADANLARAVLVDTLAFATSSAANATAVRLALLDAAAAAAAEDGADEVGEARNAAPCVWSAWGDVLPHDDGGAVAAPMGRRDEDVEGVIARHVAATAARGLPQLPAPMLLQGSVQAVAELLPTASPEQARRLLLGLLPAVVQAAGGGAALHAALEEAGAAEGLPTAGALSMEVMRTCLLAPVMRRGGGAAAAAVALSMALACRAAAAALRAAAAADAAAVASAPALLPAVGDRCAAHLALLASRLSAAASASARTLDGAGGGGGNLGVAAIAVVLLSELCGVATVAWELASPGNDRALDVWQAILLSVLQCLVAALAVSEPPLRPLPAAAAAAASDVRQLLRSALRALRTLPNPAAAVLQGSLERLCEEQEPHSDQQEDRGAGAAGGGGGGGLSAALHAVMSEDGGRDVEYVLR
ncbi:hypothetical protein PLESTB_000167300 [Pleodorina starrii]|uniref:Uncharacterized protein n=1 Tax=Pleodorina starrii TaxID=330485 RepID=A0A9W6EY76_9CHLO|nr:hypothetical protein PLESTB_000167300 [Pleodorina starrii]